MVARKTESDGRRPKILIPDTTPLSLLGFAGGLDLIFAPGAEVWVTDVVKEEVLRDPGEDKDQRKQHRADIAAWLRKNEQEGRIQVMPTDEGQEYEADMAAYRNAIELWNLAGRPKGRRPSRPARRNRGDRRILSTVRLANSLVASGECVVVLADDHGLRNAVEATLRPERGGSVNLVGTPSLIRLVHETLGIQEAATAWWIIERFTTDPVYLRAP